MPAYRTATSGLFGFKFAILIAAIANAEYLENNLFNVSALIINIVSLFLLARLMERTKRNETRKFVLLKLELEKAARQAEDLIQCSSDLVWETNAAGIFTFMSNHNNIAFSQSGVVVGNSVAQLATHDPLTSPETWKRQIDSNLRGEPFRDFRYCLERNDGSIVYLSTNGVPIRDANGGLAGFRGLTRDITHEVEALDRLNQSVLSDPLTGLANRRAVRQWLSEAGVTIPNQPVPEGTPVRPFVYLLLDLDGFKAVNDLYGHVAGDEVLIAVAQRLQRILGGTGLCARIGGDEFAIILEGADEITAEAFGRRIVVAMAEPVPLSSGEFAHFGVSIGISLCPRHSHNAQTLFRCADQALYEVKHRGGGAVRVADDRETATVLVPTLPKAEPCMPRAAVRRREEASLVRSLRGALARGEFHLVFQPIVSTVQGEATAYEALLRWTSPDHGNVSPAQFIPLAEMSGLILPIGAYVLGQACRMASESGGDWAVTVNVSALQFAQNDLVTQVLDTLATTGLSPSRLILELTEQSLVSDHVEVRARMRALRAAGVRLALDDFGAGFANVSYLRDFSFDLVKIDRAILLLPDHQRARVLGALLEITQSFETPTVVEGIETLADQTMAQSLGCTFMQGYFLGRPARNFAASTMEWGLPQAREVARLQIHAAG